MCNPSGWLKARFKQTHKQDERQTERHGIFILLNFGSWRNRKMQL